MAGDWVPTRHDEWYNNNPGKHKWRARMGHTKITYDAHGHGIGWVGEFNVQTTVTPIAAGQFTFTSRLTSGFWSASDGRMTLHSDGTMEVRIPSNGIVEYWVRADGCAQEMLECENAKAENAAKEHRRNPKRKLKLVFRHFGTKNTDYYWHWALAVDERVYEVAGSMAVVGPEGVVASNHPMLGNKRTALEKFDGYLPLQTTTRYSNDEIHSFIKDWVATHPKYNAFGPNCQTFAEDLHTFLAGETLPFRKFTDRVGKKGAEGPESDPRSVWFNREARPGAPVAPKSFAQRLGRMIMKASV